MRNDTVSLSFGYVTVKCHKRDDGVNLLEAVWCPTRPGDRDAKRGAAGHG